MAGTHYRDLFAWQSAMKLAEDVYQHTAEFPASERFGLARQLRRAAVSVPSNIAEGQSRQSKPDFRRMLRIARGSLGELETQVELAVRLRLVAPDAANTMLRAADETGRLLSGLIRSQGE